MHAPDPSQFDPLSARQTHALPHRRPRIGIMGEFSAGKSTLTNLLLGSPALPVRVTATQLPPVWLSFGDGAAHGVDLDGGSFDIDLERPDTIPLDSTQYLRVQRDADVLQMFDLIDFPGISDPNMSADVWQRALPLLDGVLWCTPATQAWRQTEAAVWEDMPETLQQRSLLLLTRIDRIADMDDRRRVLARVLRETDGQFAGHFPISLTHALAAGEDQAAWEACGAAALSDGLLDLVTQLDPAGGALPRTPSDALRARDSEARPAKPVSQAAAVRDAGPQDDGARVTPRRVRVRTRALRSPRPAPEDVPDSAVIER